MTRYVALLRAIGPATHARMPLGQLAARLGGDALNIGNTGNLLLSSEASADVVCRLVAEAVRSFDLELDVFVRTRRQWQMLVGLSPFPKAQAECPNALGVCFFHKAPAWPASYRDYAGPEQLMMFSNHLVVDYRGKTTGSRLTVEKTTGARMTQRNWSSVLRIATRFGILV